jgi:hypothetical protein
VDSPAARVSRKANRTRESRTWESGTGTGEPPINTTTGLIIAGRRAGKNSRPVDRPCDAAG